jgi:hypothetical protein
MRDVGELVARGGWLLEREEHRTAMRDVEELVARGGWLLEREAEYCSRTNMTNRI